MYGALRFVHRIGDCDTLHCMHASSTCGDAACAPGRSRRPMYVHVASCTYSLHALHACTARLAPAPATGLQMMTFDCEDGLDKVAALCPAARLVLRIRADDPTAVVQLGSKFGADADAEAPALLAAARRHGLTVIGVSFHVGCSSKDPQAYCKAIEAARRTWDAAVAEGFEVTVLDIGGGFTGAFDESGEVVLADVAATVNEALTRCFPPQQCPGLAVIAEPGKYFAEACMTLFALVHTVKTRPGGGGLYYITDGANNFMRCCAASTCRCMCSCMRTCGLPYATKALWAETFSGQSWCYDASLLSGAHACRAVRVIQGRGHRLPMRSRAHRPQPRPAGPAGSLHRLTRPQHGLRPDLRQLGQDS